MKKRTIHIWLIVLILFVMASVVAIHYGSTQVVKYEPSETEKLQLQVLQLKAINAQKDFNYAQNTFNQSVKELTDKSLEIKKAHKWDDSVIFEPNSLTYSIKAPEKKGK